MKGRRQVTSAAILKGLFLLDISGILGCVKPDSTPVLPGSAVRPQSRRPATCRIKACAGGVCKHLPQIAGSAETKAAKSGQKTKTALA
jgi:hypothetical protein